MFLVAKIFCMNADADSSNWRGIIRGAASITVICNPSSCNASAASSPKTPPPMMTACFLPWAYSRNANASSLSLMLNTPSAFAPLIGGIKLDDPVAKINLS